MQSCSLSFWYIIVSFGKVDDVNDARWLGAWVTLNIVLDHDVCQLFKRGIIHVKIVAKDGDDIKGAIM